MIRIPTVSSYAWVHYRTDWVQLDAPRHIFLHSLKSMDILALTAVFTIIDTIFDSCELRFWGSEQCRRGITRQRLGDETAFFLKKA